jgi:hypothetical protein
MGNYSKSALMITDMSGTAYTYAFTTLRPVVFFSYNERELLKRYGELRYLKDRAKVGYVVENVEDMVNRAKLLLEQREAFSEGIRKYRDATIYNVGSAEDYFVDNFEYIAGGKKHPDWVYV